MQSNLIGPWEVKSFWKSQYINPLTLPLQPSKTPTGEESRSGISCDKLSASLYPSRQRARGNRYVFELLVFSTDLKVPLTRLHAAVKSFDLKLSLENKIQVSGSVSLTDLRFARLTSPP